MVDLQPTQDSALDYMYGARSQELIRKTDWYVKEWEKDVLIGARRARDHALRDRDDVQCSFTLGPEPKGSFPVCGLASIEDWDALRFSPGWKRLIEMDGTVRVDAPTTLGRIESSLARWLIARGYLNT